MCLFPVTLICSFAFQRLEYRNQKLMCGINVLTDVATTYPDKKSILMYITSLFQVLPQQVSIEAIQEVEMLPRPSKVTKEEHFQLHHQMHYSQQVNVKRVPNINDIFYRIYIFSPHMHKYLFYLWVYA